MREFYQGTKFNAASHLKIEQCNAIISEYVRKGFKLTVRQIYYQMVARGYIENSVQSYDNIQALLNKSRLAGLTDWDAIEDRTREVMTRAHWGSVTSILKAAANGYHEDLWAEQPNNVLVIIEKEALAGIFQSLLHSWDVPLLPARGYASATTLREVAMRYMLQDSRSVHILHFGDHDPSGIDCSRDLEERLRMFCRNEVDFDFKRVALNMDQIEELRPPPFAAKITDARYRSYVDSTSS